MAKDEDFTAFVAEASAPLLRLAWLLTGHREQAQDLAQSALVRTYSSWRRIRTAEALPYARRIVVNLHVDGQRRRPWRENPTGEPPDQPAAPDATATVDDRLTVLSLLRTLTARERAVVVMRFYLDLPETQVAAELGVSVGTVKSVASRSLAKLRITATSPFHPEVATEPSPSR